MPGAGGKPVRFAEIRAALHAGVDGTNFRVSPETQSTAEAAALNWLWALSPVAQMFVTMFNGRSAPVAPGEEAAVLEAQRATAPMAVLTSMLGDRFHRIHFWFASAHLSLISGVTGERAVAAFDPQRAVDELTVHFRTLEPITQTAVVRIDTDITQACNGVHAHIDLPFLTKRKIFTIQSERRLEDNGVVDAQGIVYVTDPPPGIAPTWEQRPFGHLIEITAPDLQAWFTNPRDTATIERGRAALAPLLRTSAQ